MEGEGGGGGGSRELVTRLYSPNYISLCFDDIDGCDDNHHHNDDDDYNIIEETGLGAFDDDVDNSDEKGDTTWKVVNRLLNDDAEIRDDDAFMK